MERGHSCCLSCNWFIRLFLTLMVRPFPCVHPILCCTHLVHENLHENELRTIFKNFFPPSFCKAYPWIVIYLHDCPRGLTFTWWECYGLYLWHKPTELAHSFLFSSSVYFCLCGHFNCISFHTFSGQLSVFSVCSSILISASLVLSTVLYISSWKSPSALM